MHPSPIPRTHCAPPPLPCQVRQSEVVVLLGENGMGKTTFGKLLTGQLEAPDATLPKQKVSLKPQSIVLKDGSPVAAMKALGSL